MVHLLKSLTESVKHWYIPLILGIMFIVCGIYIFTSPLVAYLTLSVFFSVSFVVSGILDIIFSIRNAKIFKGWGWYLISGLLSLIMGIYLVTYPQLSMAVLPFVAGFTLMFRSFQLLGFSLDLKGHGVPNWGNSAILSILGVILSFMLLANPIFSGFSIVLLTGMSFLFTGIASSVLAFDLRKLKKFPERITKELKEKIENLQNEINNAIK